MITYRFKYYMNGDICIDYIDAPDLDTALVIFYTQYRYDDIIDICSGTGE